MLLLDRWQSVRCADRTDGRADARILPTGSQQSHEICHSSTVEVPLINAIMKFRD